MEGDSHRAFALAIAAALLGAAAILFFATRPAASPGLGNVGSGSAAGEADPTGPPSGDLALASSAAADPSRLAEAKGMGRKRLRPDGTPIREGPAVDEVAERRKAAEKIASYLGGRVPAATLEWIRDQAAPAEGINEAIARVAIQSLPKGDATVQSFLLSEVVDRDETPELVRFEVSQRIATEALAETLPAVSARLDAKETNDGVRWNLIVGLVANPAPEAREIVKRAAELHTNPHLRKFAAEKLAGAK